MIKVNVVEINQNFIKSFYIFQFKVSESKNAVKNPVEKIRSFKQKNKNNIRNSE